MESDAIKFGDEISWDHHVDEVLESKGEIYYSSNAEKTFENSFGDVKDLIQTDTEIVNRKAMDCGCHVGRWCDIIEKNGFKYTGVDQSKKALNVAKLSRANHIWVNSFLWDIPFKEEFDFAFTNAVLQHNLLSEQERIVPKIYESLKPGGIFLMTESTEPVTTRTQRTHQGWIDMVEKCGFKFIKAFHMNPIGFNDKYIFIKEKKL